ncbi:Methylase of polypeptide chain release factors [Hahella chejuensis KCTC 2396]|uniref:Ribosomal protein uL3 glutamine methyltransferase n=1 Tax=Hahella chejuensis (strain KCTC 2396) TaxID=349521 RepID=Q2SJE5_HAHCH|nr:50S ribosomal protein L3 N(5)-glutamine methyltransferase [Hahella chejuensis]ABC29229.1 Methylase of polypeptide chain release factors [Hahella chejuensis KCTC 2396]
MFEPESFLQLQTIRDFIRYAWSRFNQEALFFGHGTDNAWDEAVHLVLGSLHLPWDVDANMLDARLVDHEKLALAEAIGKRVLQRIPTPYILGEAWFMGLPFHITQDVLIPRSPIAELLEHELQPWLEQPPLRILDLCCGSGCIGIAAAHVFPEAEVVLADISPLALDVARRNVARHHLGDRCKVVESDMFDALQGEFDVILTNPPYVDKPDMDSLPPEYLHEPELGLASGVDGLDAARIILARAADFLSDGGFMVCEVGNSMEALQNSYPEIMFIFPEFEKGGDGVFVMTKDDLLGCRELL